MTSSFKLKILNIYVNEIHIITKLFKYFRRLFTWNFCFSNKYPACVKFTNFKFQQHVLQKHEIIISVFWNSRKSFIKNCIVWTGLKIHTHQCVSYTSVWLFQVRWYTFWTTKKVTFTATWYRMYTTFCI